MPSTALPENACSLVSLTSGNLSLSRWQGAVFLNAFGAPAPGLSTLLAGLGEHGVELVPVEDWRWRLGGEAEARRALHWLLEHWPDVARVELTLVAPGLPGACVFRFELNRERDDDIHLTPDLEFHRDLQRVRVPQTEAWLLELLKAPEFGARSVWDAEWQISRAGLTRLLQGPMDPFEPDGSRAP